MLKKEKVRRTEEQGDPTRESLLEEKFKWKSLEKIDRPVRGEDHLFG